MVTEPVGDFINRIQNAGAVKKQTVSVPFSTFKLAIAEKLKEIGLVKQIEKKGKKVKKTLDITLKYTEAGKPIISGVKRVSKPGRRLYRSVDEIIPVRYGHGHLIL